MASATEALSKLSTAPKKAMENAAGSSDITLWYVRPPKSSGVIDTVTSPNNEPMVATGRLVNEVAKVTTVSTTNAPGIFGHRRTMTTKPTKVAEAISTDHGLNDAALRASTYSFSTNSPGNWSTVIPKKSFSWLERMVMAMPAVNPMMMGCGM